MKSALVAGSATLAFTIVAHAEVPAGAGARLDAAIARFEALARTTQAEGRLPQLSHPNEKPVLDAMWDTSLLGRPPFVKADLDAIEAMDQAAHRVTTTYMGGEPPTEQDIQFLRISPELKAHAEKYPDEIVRASVFEFQITVDWLSASADKWTQLRPESRKAEEADAIPVRDGVIGKLFHVPHLFTSSVVSGASTMVWADALARNAAAIADVMPPMAREALILNLKDELPKLPAPLKPKLEALVEAMSTRPCEGFCLVQIVP